MKRERESDPNPASGLASASSTASSHASQGTAESRAQARLTAHSSPASRAPATNGAANGKGISPATSNGSGSVAVGGSGRKPRSNGDGGISKPNQAPAGANGDSGASKVTPAAGSTGGTLVSPAPPSSATSSSPASLSAGPAPSPSSSYKRARFGIIEPPEGWREVAERLLRARDSDSAGSEEGELTEAGPASRHNFAVVCSANFNRSMMAHKLMLKHGFRVKSYGTGRDVRLPGKDLGTPEVYAFGTPYLHIYDSLRAKDEEFFRRNNLLGLVARNATIKTAPERFQDIPGQAVANFDLVLCFDSRVFYLVVEDLQSRDPEMFKPLHVVNITIKDSPEESAAAAGDVLEICRTLDGLDELEDEVAQVLDAFAKRSRRTILHQVCHV